ILDPSCFHEGRKAPKYSKPLPEIIKSGALIVVPASTSVPGITQRKLPLIATIPCAVFPKSATDLNVIVLDDPGATVTICGSSAPAMVTKNTPELAFLC